MNLFQPRTVASETLDYLPATDPRAVRSRADLRRINRLMGASSVLAHALRHAIPPPRSMVEIGAGDGTLMLALARRLAGNWPAVRLTLLDRQMLVSDQTMNAFDRLGWSVDVLTMDVEHWLQEGEMEKIAEDHGENDVRKVVRDDSEPSNSVPDSLAPHRPQHGLILANLFLHHFDDARLRCLLGAIAARTAAFVACEPRRHWLALSGSRLVGLIGANEVTREDAVLSVRAGFCGRELSALWPVKPEWSLTENRQGLFSHCFRAVRQSGQAVS